MTSSAGKFDELYVLLDDLCDGSISESGAERLDSLLQVDPEARREYLSYLDVHAGLGLIAGKPLDSLSDVAADELPSDVAAVQLSDGATAHLSSQIDIEPQISNPHFPSLSTTHYPLSTNFVGGPVFSYMVATVILGMMLLGAWAYKITHYQQIAHAPSVTSNARPALVFVGRITGMADCRWADPSTAAYAGASVPLGRK